MTFSLGVFHLQLVFSLLVLALWGVLAAMGLHKSGFELKTTITKHAIGSPTMYAEYVLSDCTGGW